MSKILIIGASSGIGLETVAQGLANGHRIRAMARSAKSIAIQHDQLEKFSGDALNASDVASALEDIDVVVQTLGIPVNSRMLFGPVTLFSEATRILLPEMETAGIRRLICVTGFGAGDSRSSVGCLQSVPFRLVLGRAYDDKSEQERLITNSILDWTIARPGILTNGPLTSRYKVLTEPASWRNGLISRTDVADFLIKQIDDDTNIRKAAVLID